MKRLMMLSWFAFFSFVILPVISEVFAQIGPPKPEPVSAFKGNLFTMLQKQPLPYDEALSNTLLGKGEFSSVSLIQVREKVDQHYHAEHEEMVYIMQGKGIMTVGGETKPVQPGDLIMIPRGVAHDVINRSAQPLVAISVFSPPFDGKDRIFLEKTEE